MSEKSPEQSEVSKEQSLKDKMKELRFKDFITTTREVDNFFNNTIIPAFIIKFPDSSKAFSGEPSPQARLARYKIYHIMVGSSGYKINDFFDFDDLGISAEKFIDDLYKKLVTNEPNS